MPQVDDIEVGGDGPGAPPTAERSGLSLEPTVVLAPVLMLASLGVLSVPGRAPLRLLLLAAWIVVLAIAGVDLVRRIVRQRRGSEHERPLWMFFIAPVFAVITAALVVTAVPIRARFAIAQDDLTTAARAVLDADQDGTGSALPDRIGSYPVQSVRSDGTNVWFVTSGLGTNEKWGFAFVPAGVAPPGSGSYLVELDGGWWLWAPEGANVVF